MRRDWTPSSRRGSKVTNGLPHPPGVRKAGAAVSAASQARPPVRRAPAQKARPAAPVGTAATAVVSVVGVEVMAVPAAGTGIAAVSAVGAEVRAVPAVGTAATAVVSVVGVVEGLVNPVVGAVAEK